ncbi:TspO/MBR family protein [Sporosarcina sp. YIM B06819]|uniref:TspO/MBR family protein n=1 Tax=Sporosarcina sp. YIM B06819 TaxID=3081769 RepID=UPI00298D3D79|nr:TspO/MBR family protein [Sporosarcina sp. YIM B06819]
MKWLGLLSYLFMIVVNGIANTIGINGKKTGEISGQIDVLFTPAPYVFSIWTVIYIVLAIWIFLQFRSPTQNQDSTLWLLFIATCFYNVAWLLSWHYEYFIVSVIVMVGLLISLILIYRSYPIGDYHFSGRLPFSIYLGWISVALMANISFVLKYYEWSGFGMSEQFWANILLLLATLLAMYIRFYYKDILFPLVIIWSFIGISVQNGKDAGSLFYMPLVYCVILFIWIFIGKNSHEKRK